MTKQVILITGTPAVGKTTLAKQLAAKINAEYINLTNLAKNENLVASKDLSRDTTIIDEVKMRQKLRVIIKEKTNDIVIDGHYAAAVTPKPLVTNVFVLRRSPIELKQFMQDRGYSQAKQDENLAAEILDVCLVEALQKQAKERVCELDITGKTVEETLAYVLAVLEGKQTCGVGGVDWLGMLEKAGKLNEYLKE